MNDPTPNSTETFLANLRHDLRTPLNQIIGYSEMLLEEAGEKGASAGGDDLGKILAAARTLLALVNESLVASNFGGLAAAPARLAAGLDRTLPASPAPRRPAFRGEEEHGRLLVVDDNAENGDMLSRRLRKQGYEVRVAGNGRVALEMARATEFDLVLLDILMPEMDGYQTLERLKSDPDLRDIPVIMISAVDDMGSVIRCIEIGAEDYLPKPFDPVLLRARIGACLEKKRARDREQLYARALLESRKNLAAELAGAAAYVKSLLPAPVKGEIAADWRYLPSEQLGGDAFGCHWLDPEHLAMFLLDVEGHGVGAAFLSVSVMNVLRSRSLPAANFGDPSAVLNALNEAFPKERQGNRSFTIWYGVYDKPPCRLVYASAGHPPAVLVTETGDGPARAERLDVPGVPVGSMPKVSYRSVARDLAAPGKLYLFSDGVYEITKTDGTKLTFDQFIQLLAAPSVTGVSDLDRISRRLEGVHGSGSFEDDFSLVQIVFN